MLVRNLLKMKKIGANFSDKYINQNYSCFQKSYNRSFSTIYILATTKIPIKKFSFSVSFKLDFECFLLDFTNR